MAAKRVWLTWLTKDDVVGPPTTVAALSKAGFEVAGAAWDDDLEKVAWTELASHLAETDAEEIWLVGGKLESFAEPTKRYGLSMVTAVMQAKRDPLPHVFFLGMDGAPDMDDMPTLLRGARALDASAGAWAERILAATLRKPTAPDEAFRFNVLADPHMGQWFELGPATGSWNGAMLGITGEGEIQNHAVGPAGALPERTVLEYALEGMQADIAGDEYTLFAVQNDLGPDQSYYVKVFGHPTKMVVGQHPDSDAEVSVLKLK